MKAIIKLIFGHFGILPHQIGERLWYKIPIRKKNVHTILECIINYFYKKRLNSSRPRKHSEVVIVFTSQLGLGDVLMLSPLITILMQHCGRPVKIASSFECVFPEHLNSWKPLSYLKGSARRRSLIIFPTFSAKNASLLVKYRFNFLGYLLTENISSNYTRFSGSYKIKNTNHYVDRITPIIEKMGIFDSVKEADYPKIKSNKMVLPHGKYVIIAPYAVWKERRAGIDVIKAVLEKYFDPSYKIIIVGAAFSREMEYAKIVENELLRRYNVTNLIGKTTLSEFCYLSRFASGYIGNDSGPTQLAIASSCKKVIVLDGCVPYDLRLPKFSSFKNDILFFNKAQKCPFYPCFTGYERPICINSEKYWCLPVRADIL
jgi:hypothetical protein